jgi:transcriptional regulator with XRE-family HTH domain
MTIKPRKDLNLGEYLRAHRLGEEITQVEFADLLGISKQRLCDIEHNRATVSIKLAKAIAKKLKLPPEWLVKLSLQDQLNREGVDLKVG